MAEKDARLNIMMNILSKNEDYHYHYMTSKSEITVWRYWEGNFVHNSHFGKEKVLLCNLNGKKIDAGFRLTIWIKPLFLQSITHWTRKVERTAKLKTEGEKRPAKSKLLLWHRAFTIWVGPSCAELSWAVPCQAICQTESWQTQKTNLERNHCCASGAH